MTGKFVCFFQGNNSTLTNVFVFLNYSHTSRIFFWVNVILHLEKQEVYACLATAKEIRSECWSRSGFIRAKWY